MRLNRGMRRDGAQLTVLQRALFIAPLKSSAILMRGVGNPTFTRATTAYVTDFEGLLKNCKSGEIRLTGARREQNLCVYSDDITKLGTVDGTTPPTIGTASFGGRICEYITFPTGVTGYSVSRRSGGAEGGQGYVASLGRTFVANVDTFNYSLKIGLSRQLAGGETLNVVITGSSGTTTNITLTSANSTALLRYAKTTTFAGSPSGGVGFYVYSSGVALGSPITVYIAEFELKDVTGQADQNPAECVSSGVLSAPYHGAGVDGVKCFPYENGNMVVNNVVAEAQGAAIPEATLKGYLSEPAATNLLTYSNDITNAAWAKTTLTTAKTSTGPDGVANSATRCTATGANSLALQTITAAASSRTSSFYVKRITGTGAFELTQDNSSFTAKTTTAEWTRVDLNASILNAQVGFRIVTSGDAFDIWCGQFEAGTFATSPIPTTTVAVARNKDLDSEPTSGNISAASGTIYGEFTPNHSPLAATSLYLWGTYVNASNSTSILHDGTNLIFRKRIAGVNYDATIANTYVSGTAYKYAASWGAAGTTIVLSGTVGTPNANTTAAQIAATMQEGADGNGAGQPTAQGKNRRIWQTQLPNATLQAITS